MPPKKKIRRSTRANENPSAASTPASNIPDSDSAMPDADEDNPARPSPSLKSPIGPPATPTLSSNKNNKPRKPPINDEWTDEQDTSLFKGLIQWKPVGMHKHFRMISLCNFLRNHGYDPEVETHTRPAGIREHLEKYYDLETLGQREDHIDEDPSYPLYIEFSLPLDEYGERMWEQGRIKKKTTAKKLVNPSMQDTTDSEVEIRDSSIAPSIAPSIVPSVASSVPKKRKRADTTTTRITRASTVDETDDARSSVIHSRAPSEVPTASTNRAARGNKRNTRVASSSRAASKDITADESSHIGDDDNGDEQETDDTASVKAPTRSNAKAGKGGAQAKGQATAARKSGRKK